AIVAVWIVRRREHHAEIEALLACEVSDRGRGNDAGGRHGRALRRRAARQLALDPFSGFTRVAADDDPRRPRSGARAHDRSTQSRDGGRVERIHTSNTSDAVGTKQSLTHERTRTSDSAT